MKTKLILTLILGIVLGASPSAIAQNKGAADMVIKGGNLGDVPFPHHQHQSILGDCGVCHSLFPQATGGIEELKAQEKLRKKEVMDQCQACHKQKAGPTKCTECHKK